MKRLAFIIFALLTIGVIAQRAQSQWGRYYPYWGYYPYYWSPYYGWPVAVYDPVRARQLEIEDNLEKLNNAKNKLLAVLNAPTEKNLKEAREGSASHTDSLSRERAGLNDASLPANCLGQRFRETIAPGRRHRR